MESSRRNYPEFYISSNPYPDAIGSTNLLVSVENKKLWSLDRNGINHATDLGITPWDHRGDRLFVSCRSMGRFSPY